MQKETVFHSLKNSFGRIREFAYYNFFKVTDKAQIELKIKNKNYYCGAGCMLINPALERRIRNSVLSSVHSLYIYNGWRDDGSVISMCHTSMKTRV